MDTFAEYMMSAGDVTYFISFYLDSRRSTEDEKYQHKIKIT